MLERYTRGQRFYGGDTSLVVLGGPTRFNGRIDYYTLIATGDGAIDFGAFGHLYVVEQAQTYVIQGAAIQVVMRKGEIWTEKDLRYFRRWYSGDYSQVIEQECPSCGIEEMIFYSEDYICAWCRERMEEGL